MTTKTSRHQAIKASSAGHANARLPLTLGEGGGAAAGRGAASDASTESRPCPTPPSGKGLGRRGFTLIEAIVVIVILGVLAAVIAPRFLGRIGQSKQSLAASNAASLASAVRSYMADHGEPEEGATIDILIERPSDVSEESWEAYVEKADDLLDPWGNKFVLVVPGKRNATFDIVSYGRDGKPGGEGEDADIIKP